MGNLYLPTVLPQAGDNEKLLLARLGGALAGPTNLLPNAYFQCLVSAARTANTTSAVFQTPSWARNLLLHMNVTGSSGTGGLRMGARLGFEPTLAYGTDLHATTGITVNGARIYYLGPAAGNNVLGVTSGFSYLINAPLAPFWWASVLVGDATSYTYEVKAAYCP